MRRTPNAPLDRCAPRLGVWCDGDSSIGAIDSTIRVGPRERWLVSGGNATAVLPLPMRYCSGHPDKMRSLLPTVWQPMQPGIPLPAAGTAPASVVLVTSYQNQFLPASD